MHKLLVLGDIGEIELRILRATALLRGKYDIIISDAAGNITVHELKSLTGRLQGKRPTTVIVDEVRDPVGEYLVEQVYRLSDRPVQCEPVLPKPDRKGPQIEFQSKGDRRRNRRYRWA